MGRKDMLSGLGLALGLAVAGCGDAPALVHTAADAAAPFLGELASLYEAAGARCIAVQPTRAMADACLANLRTAWDVWDALEPVRTALDGLRAIADRWAAAEAKRWPPAPAARCVTPPAAP